jgi:hypothetical protein
LCYPKLAWVGTQSKVILLCAHVLRKGKLKMSEQEESQKVEDPKNARFDPALRVNDEVSKYMRINAVRLFVGNAG